MAVNKVTYGNKTLIDLTSDTVTASKLLSGVTAHDKKGVKITGTIPSQGAQTITPGTANKTIAAGKYLSGTQTIKGDANLVAENIAEGVSIFGVTGTHAGSSPLNIVYSNTEPSAGAGELWVKAAQAEKVYITPSVELDNYVVTENTGCINATRTGCAGTGGYNGKIYWIAWTGSMSSSGNAVYSLYSYNPATNTIALGKNGFITAHMYQNYSGLHAAQLKGNKFYLASYSGTFSLAILDLDTLVVTTITNPSFDILSNSSSSSNRYYIGISADGSKVITGTDTSGVLQVYDIESLTKTSYTITDRRPQWFFDDGTYLYVIHGRENPVVRVLNSSTYALVASVNLSSYGHVKACFQVGGNIYLGTGISSIYKMVFENGEFTFTHITDDAPEWGTSATYSDNASAQKYGDIYGWSSNYAKNSYCAIGDTLYCLYMGDDTMTGDVAVKRVKFSASSYSGNALVIATSGEPTHRAKLIQSDALDLGMFIGALYKTDSSGNLMHVEGYTKNAANEWVAI